MARLIQIKSLDVMDVHRASWNDLWQRSDTSCPTARAEHILQWVEKFAPHAGFRAFVVEDRGCWIAALPLVQRRVLNWLKAGGLPVNSWATGGSLLLDPACDIQKTLDLLVAGVADIGWPLLWLDEIRLDATSATAIKAAFARAKIPTSTLERYRVGRLDIAGGWEDYCQNLSKAMKKNLRQAAHRLARLGKIHFTVQTQFDLEEVAPLLRRGFLVEDCSWKGRAGTSVLAAGMFPYYLQQAQELARADQLQLAFLEANGRPVAFAYGSFSKGVYHGYKVGYDETFARCSPGLLLEEKLFQHLWNTGNCQAVDFMGVFSDAQRAWRPSTCRVGRLVIASKKRMLGKTVVYAHEHWWPYLRQLRRHLRGLKSPPVGPTTAPQLREQS